ncbi:putative secreted protein [Acidisarcina polymorpha]|uniref:Putative secreted protein n=1 Tax=Acidisarcina polymorpha TaxID=2211140 RepID=A0A2Z5G465_9BACT|nr:DM13 domain-containing protein [Acidisarcina polymorpha]AXC13932.1 putative secreted protein [Acidisarcina polymorpha]
MVGFLRKHKALSGMVSAIILTALWYLFRPEKLFINERVNEAAPVAAVGQAHPIYTGRLHGELHEVSGRATILRQTDGTLILRLSDFHTTIDPDLHVVLALADDPALKSTSPGKGLASVDVGALKGNVDDQSYSIPANTDPARYNTVAIYSERSQAVFGAASLQPF